MAHTDYISRNLQGSFSPTATVTAALTHATATITIDSISEPSPGAIRVGMAAMIGNEIVGIQARAGNVLTLLRGCCDTIPQAHVSKSRIFFFDDAVIGDTVEYGGSETVGVKPLPRTVTGGPIAKSKSPAAQITFNFRFARPYPPGNVRVNANPWHGAFTLAAGAVESLNLTWAHRDRVTQQNALVDHGASSIGPETGVQYEALVYDSANVLLREIGGITGTTWSYPIDQMIEDFNVTTGVHVGYLRFRSVRGEFASWQDYRIDFSFNAENVAIPIGLGRRLGRYLGGVLPAGAPVPAPSVSEAASLLTNLRAWWSFDENSAGTVYLDQHAANHLTLQTGLTPTATSAVSTAAVGNFVAARAAALARILNRAAYIPRSNSDFDQANASFTFGAWVKIAQTPETTAFIMGRVGSNDSAIYAYVYIDGSGGDLKGAVTSDGTTATRVSTAGTASYSDTEMQLLTFSLNRANNEIVLRLRRPGANSGNVVKQTAPFAPNLFTGSTTSNFAFGHGLAGDGSSFFSGNRNGIVTVDEGFYLNAAISDAEFDYLYNGATGRNYAGLVGDAAPPPPPPPPPPPLYPSLETRSIDLGTITFETGSFGVVDVRLFNDGRISVTVDLIPAYLFETTWIDRDNPNYPNIALIANDYTVGSVSIAAGTVGPDPTPASLAATYRVAISGTGFNDFQIQVNPASTNPRFGDAFYFGLLQFEVDIAYA